MFGKRSQSLRLFLTELKKKNRNNRKYSRFTDTFSPGFRCFSSIVKKLEGKSKNDLLNALTRPNRPDGKSLMNIGTTMAISIHLPMITVITKHIVFYADVVHYLVACLLKCSTGKFRYNIYDWQHVGPTRHKFTDRKNKKVRTNSIGVHRKKYKSNIHYLLRSDHIYIYI